MNGAMTPLKGFAFHGYRSFPTKLPAVLMPLGKMNLIAGQNNTGKSNTLRVIADAREYATCMLTRPAIRWTLG